MKYTAHIHATDSNEQYVDTHCSETAELASKYSKNIGLEQTARIAGYLHDIGKLTTAFNDYIHGDTSYKRGDIDHSFAGAKYLKSIAGNFDDRNLQKTVSLISRVILSHHGLNNWVDDYSQDIHNKKISKDKYYTEIEHNLLESGLLNEFIPSISEAVSEVTMIRSKLKKMSGTSKEQFAFYLGMLERLLQSILIDADRTNTADFMSNTKTEIEFDTDKIWLDMEEQLKEILDMFSLKNDDISKQRQSISERCHKFAANDSRICKLVVPTGGGKTLSSLRFAIENAKRYHKKKIIYIAPFMSILEQNSDIIKNIAGESVFLEHHSDIIAEIVDDEDKLHEYELRTEKWDSPVIATTMVQFLNSLFSGKSSSVRRMHRLSEAVIIIDEVQSLPLKCVYLFNLAVNFLSHVCGSTIVLCSATQPPFDELEDFPLLIDKISSMTGDTTVDFEVFRRTELVFLEKKGGYSFDEASYFCQEQFGINGSLLLVVNTKSAAIEMYKRLRDIENAYVFHLSTNMCPEHRRKSICKMKEKLSQNENVICITTQLIEAGVDISFGCVVRSIAGMDNAVQASGRCNRSGEYNRICPVYIMHMWEEKLGSLTEIKTAGSISREIAEISENKDYLGVELLKNYFRKLYRSERRKLRYPLPDSLDQDLINLLSLNKERIDKKKTPHLEFCGQSFKRAGMLFEVIDNNTTTIIVPYNNEAKQLISELCSWQTYKNTLNLLRKAQKYSVSIYSGTQHVLENEKALYEIKCGGNDECTAIILKEEFYDDDLGVTTENGLHEVLLF